MISKKAQENIYFTLAALIWPGPINGPLPVTFFKLLTPIVILAYGVFAATLVMSFLASALVLFYFYVISHEVDSAKIRNWVDRLPKSVREAAKVQGVRSLFPVLITFGPFPLAIGFRLLTFRGLRYQMILVAGTFLNSAIWTGFFWGGALTLIRVILLPGNV